MSLQYIHQAIYGHAGVEHTAQPQYVVRGDEVYATAYNKDMPKDMPIFNVRGGKWYRSQFHPEGESAHAIYETIGERIHTTQFHPEHNAGGHAFEMRSNLAR